MFAARFKVRNKMRANLRRHGTHCAYCNVKMEKGWSPNRPTRDHIIPLSRGGLDVLDNITLACLRCNTEKASLFLDEFMAWREGRASRLDKGMKWRTLRTKFEIFKRDCDVIR